MRVTILGCGASTGVPVIGCNCRTCISENPKNTRSRVSILVQYATGATVLVDTSPDLRNQLLVNNIKRIDAIIYTHAHADHSHGIDDIRPFNMLQDAAIPAYGTADTLMDLKQRFSYVWPENTKKYWPRAALKAHEIEAGQSIHLPSGEVIETFEQTHGNGTTLGLKFGDIVYSTDVNAFPKASEPMLKNLKWWIVDCLRDGFAGSHASLDVALEWIEKYTPNNAVLTHMNHELEYEALNARLPKNVFAAYDNMQIVDQTNN
ncbi:MAG: MBL fold metallo-hydrolase [Alphaproteobacteria bacterium]|nr:MBL fold metallo-hydrolase [Alphaproteobacteria bacterium]